jgi:hypothetical protein
MALDTCFIDLEPIRWRQSITHGIEHQEGYKLFGEFNPDRESTVHLSSGHMLRDLPVTLGILDIEPWLDRGIGSLSFLEAREPRDWDSGSEASVSGTMCLTHDYFVEVWRQIQRSRYTNCQVQLQIGPMSGKGAGWFWDLNADPNRRYLFILGASFRFTHMPPR